MVVLDAWRFGDFSDGVLGAPQRGGVRLPVVHAQVEPTSAAMVKTTKDVVEATHQVTHVPGCVGDLPGNSLPTAQALVHAMPGGRTERDAHSASWPVEQFNFGGESVATDYVYGHLATGTLCTMSYNGNYDDSVQRDDGSAAPSYGVGDVPPSCGADATSARWTGWECSTHHADSGERSSPNPWVKELHDQSRPPGIDPGDATDGTTDLQAGEINQIGPSRR